MTSRGLFRGLKLEKIWKRTWLRQHYIFQPYQWTEHEYQIGFLACMRLVDIFPTMVDYRVDFQQFDFHLVERPGHHQICVDRENSHILQQWWTNAIQTNGPYHRDHRHRQGAIDLPMPMKIMPIYFDELKFRCLENGKASFIHFLGLRFYPLLFFCCLESVDKMVISTKNCR